MATGSSARSCKSSAKLSTTKSTAAQTVPAIMKGVRRPRLLLHLSESVPKSGSMKSASTLSAAMMTPDRLCDMPNLSVSILGIIVS